MKTIKFIQSLIVFMIISTFCASAQMQQRQTPPQGFNRPGGMSERPARPTAMKRAERKANEMAFAVNLDSKQYKKILNIFLKEENAKDAAFANFSQMGNPPAGQGGGRPQMDGPRPDRPGMGGESGGPGVGGPRSIRFNPEDFNGMEPPKVGGKAINSAEYIEAREAKFKKILTPEQYAKWHELHPDPSKSFQRQSRFPAEHRN